MCKCMVCNTKLDDNEAYEYRGALSCDDHFDEMVEMRDSQRSQIIAEESAKTEPLKGLDFGDNQIGKENRKLLSSKLEAASKESDKLKAYEGRGVNDMITSARSVLERGARG